MNVAQLKKTLASSPQAVLHIMLPSGEFVPGHFHAASSV